MHACIMTLFLVYRNSSRAKKTNPREPLPHVHLLICNSKYTERRKITVFIENAEEAIILDNQWVKNEHIF